MPLPSGLQQLRSIRRSRKQGKKDLQAPATQPPILSHRMVLLGGWFSRATRRKKRSASCGVRGRSESCTGIGGSDFRGRVERADETGFEDGVDDDGSIGVVLIYSLEDGRTDQHAFTSLCPIPQPPRQRYPSV